MRFNPELAAFVVVTACSVTPPRSVQSPSTSAGVAPTSAGAGSTSAGAGSTSAGAGSTSAGAGSTSVGAGPTSAGALQTTATAAVAAPRGAGDDAPTLVATDVPLPGATGPASLDYIFYEPRNSRVWVPAGSSGSVDVFDVLSGTFQRIGGFKTAEREIHGKKRTIGPSAGSAGDGFVYIGNRATSEVCPIDVKTLKPGRCIKLASATDGVVYVAPSKEVWVTLPSERSIAILDATNPATLKLKTALKLPGAPEGYAVDAARAIFFTNLEDKGDTLAIDIKTHATLSTWNPRCGPDGPRGVAFDANHDFLIVACTDHVQILDAGHDGAPLGELDAGAGVDNIDYVHETALLYVAAGKAARLTVARVDDKGRFALVATAATSEGARNAVADPSGNAYVADSARARLLLFTPPNPKNPPRPTTSPQ